MANTYTLLASIAQTVGLLIFVGGFLGVVTYALWPKNRPMFDRAAHLPLDKE
jgi:cytochrome c oxidase cbb3-type subunit 4